MPNASSQRTLSLSPTYRGTVRLTETKDPRLSISVLTRMLSGLISCQLTLGFLSPSASEGCSSPPPPGAFIVDLGALEAELGRGPVHLCSFCLNLFRAHIELLGSHEIIYLFGATQWWLSLQSIGTKYRVKHSLTPPSRC